MEKVMDYAHERAGKDLDEYSPWMLTDLMQNTIQFVHQVLPPELGWLGAVAISAVSVRALLFPFTINSIREGRMKSTLFPQYSEMLREMAEMKTPSSAPNSKDSQRLQSLQKRYIAFTAKYGNVALKGTLASAIQIPMILTGIVACNGIAMNPAIFPSVALESPLWLTSVSLPDPLYILPAINAALVWSNMKVFGSVDATITPKLSSSPNKNGNEDNDEQSKRLKELITSRMGRDSAERTSQQIDAIYKSKMMQYGKKMFPLFIFGVTINFPAITLVYTISNIFGAMAQNWLVANKRFQRVFDIPAQAKRSGDEVESALKRAEEIRDRINQIVKDRRSKRQEVEEAAKKLLLRRPPATVHVPQPDRKQRTIEQLLSEVKQRRSAASK
jgi:membrane protein insertase Oxa1/YidC/SpoIIIJ